MSMRDVIENLEAKHKHAERQIDFYAEQESLAKTDESREFSTKERLFWLGISYGIQGALVVVEQEEVTGGNPFK